MQEISRFKANQLALEKAAILPCALLTIAVRISWIASSSTGFQLLPDRIFRESASSSVAIIVFKPLTGKEPLLLLIFVCLKKQKDTVALY